MKLRKLLACIVITMPFLASAEAPTDRQMMFADTLQMGKPYSKDPHVIKFDGRYLMYFSLPPHSWNGTEGWRIGIAESQDLINWNRIGMLAPTRHKTAKPKGCAPHARW